jgi:hypothetical protein
MLDYLPLAHQIYLPARFIIGFSFCSGVLAALGADFLSRSHRRWGAGIAVVLLAVGLVDSWMVGPPNLRYMFHNRIEPLAKAAEFRQWFVTNPGNQTEIALANMGSANCQGYGYNSIPTTATARNNPTDISYRGEYYLLGPGRVLQTRWTPNELSYDVCAWAPTVLVINQNYYPGWRIEAGDALFVTEGTLLALKLPPGRQQVTLVYRPRFLLVAFALTLTASIATLILWRKKW